MKMHAKALSRRLAALCWVGMALLGSGQVAAHDARQHSVAWPGGNEYKQSVRSYSIPDVMLVDAYAKPVQLRELLATEDPVMVNFMFTTCSTVCPVTVKVFSEVPSKLGAAAKNLRLISVSIDPENDTPAQLKSYAKDFAGGLQWQFLTGRLEDIKTVQRAFDAYNGDKMTHAPLTLIRHARTKLWVRIDGFATPDELASEFRKTAR